MSLIVASPITSLALTNTACLLHYPLIIFIFIIIIIIIPLHLSLSPHFFESFCPPLFPPCAPLFHSNVLSLIHHHPLLLHLIFLLRCLHVCLSLRFASLGVSCYFLWVTNQVCISLCAHFYFALRQINLILDS